MEPEGSIIVFLSLPPVPDTCNEPDEYSPHPSSIYVLPCHFWFKCPSGNI